MNLHGKTVLVCGIANERSIATAIAAAAHAAGARIIATYQDERLRDRVSKVCAGFGESCQIFPCDVNDPTSLSALADSLSAAEITLDGLVHAIAFGRMHDAEGRILSVLETDCGRFTEALQISAHSLATLCAAVQQQLNPAAGIVALSYAGATQVKAGYNIMGVAKAALEAEVRYLAHDFGERGIRVNAVSAGPVRTLASSAVPGFKQRLAEHAEKSLLRRNVSTDEVANCALFLLSPAASGVTGEILFVDAGAHLRG